MLCSHQYMKNLLLTSQISLLCNFHREFYKLGIISPFLSTIYMHGLLQSLSISSISFFMYFLFPNFGSTENNIRILIHRFLHLICVNRLNFVSKQYFYLQIFYFFFFSPFFFLSSKLHLVESLL